MALASGDVFAGYTVVRLLGAGTVGEVYLATHPRLLRQDAIRVLPAALSADEQFRMRFDAQAELAATLWHPHIVGLQDRGEYQGLLWVTMDFVDGSDAASVVRDRYSRGLPADQVVDIVTNVADALDYANGRGAAHGDVKAANVLLAESPTKRVLLTDFGIPRGAADDRYGLAATAYHLLSGVLPPARGPVPPLGETRQDLAAFDPALQRAMADDPRARFGACLDFAAALRDGAAAVTQAHAVVDPRANSPTEHLMNPTTGSELPAVFVAAWSAEEPEPDYGYDPSYDPAVDPGSDPSYEPVVDPTYETAMGPVAESDAAPTMSAMPVSRPLGPLGPPGPAGRPGSAGPAGAPRPPRRTSAGIWALLAAVIVVIVAAVAIVAVRGGGDEPASTAAPRSPSTSASPSDSAAPQSTTDPANGRPMPVPLRGNDPTGENCEGGFQITGRDGWASHAVRGTPETTCVFVSNVLQAYWNEADPSAAPRTVVAAGAIPCAEGVACVGNEFLVTCLGEGSDPWITCRGGRGAVVYLY